MPKVKNNSESDSDSGPDDIRPVQKKLKVEKSKADDEEPSWLLEKMKFVKVREFRGSVMVDIREYYEDKHSGEVKPGKKGICLTLSQWKKLLSIIPEVEETLKNKA